MSCNKLIFFIFLDLKRDSKEECQLERFRILDLRMVVERVEPLTLADKQEVRVELKDSEDQRQKLDLSFELPKIQ